MITPRKWYSRKTDKYFKFFEEKDTNPLYHSSACLNNKGVFSMTLMCSSSTPINELRTQKNVGPSLKKLFGNKEYICIAKQLKVKKGVFKYAIEYYTKMKEVPSEETMSKIPTIIEDNTIPAKYIKRDPETNEILDILTYQDLMALDCSLGCKYSIIGQCDGTEEKTSESTNKKYTILGGVWEYQR